jgi:hypothetical protein
MSIVALKRNSRRFKAPISGRGKDGFSLNGGYRNQGRVGQILAGRSLGGTKFRGNTPMGNGGCCGNYVINIANTGNCCTNDPSIIKRSSMTTKGRIESGLLNPVGGIFRNVNCNTSCRRIWVADLSPLNQSQGNYIKEVSIKSAGKVVRKSDAGKESIFKRFKCISCIARSIYEKCFI